MNRITTRTTFVSFALASALAASQCVAEETEQEIKLEEAPAAVQKTLKEEAKGAAIEKVTKETEDGQTTYEGLVTIEGTKYEIEVASDGKLLEKEQAEGEDEQEIKLTEAPEAVQKSLKEHAKGAKIETVEKSTKDGKTVYEADVTIDGKKREITVGEDGKLISDEADDDQGKEAK